MQTQVFQGHTGATFKQRPVIEYQYTVDGNGYTSFQYGQRHGTARAIVARYPPGRAVDVYYNPHRPHDAVLNSNAETKGAVWIMVGGAAWLVLFAFGS